MRRGLIEQGLHLLLIRGLIERLATPDGFQFGACDSAGTVIASLESEYSKALLERAEWVNANFSDRDLPSLNAFFNDRIGRWGEEFSIVGPGWEESI